MFRFAAILAMVAGAAVAQQAVAQDDGPGPNLVIEVAGEANGRIVIDLLPDVAPKHVEQITTLASSGKYDDVTFHRVIAGFVAQTGDMEFGNASNYSLNAGRGGSDLPNIPAEFSDIPFDRGIVGMARSGHPDSANSQFFITLQPALHLTGQYTVFGRVIEGMEVVDMIKQGPSNGTVSDPDRMVSVTVQ